MKNGAKQYSFRIINNVIITDSNIIGYNGKRYNFNTYPINSENNIKWFIDVINSVDGICNIYYSTGVYNPPNNLFLRVYIDYSPMGSRMKKIGKLRYNSFKKQMESYVQTR